MSNPHNPQVTADTIQKGQIVLFKGAEIEVMSVTRTDDYVRVDGLQTQDPYYDTFFRLRYPNQTVEPYASLPLSVELVRG